MLKMYKMKICTVNIGRNVPGYIPRDVQRFTVINNKKNMRCTMYCYYYILLFYCLFHIQKLWYVWTPNNEEVIMPQSTKQKGVLKYFLQLCKRL